MNRLYSYNAPRVRTSVICPTKVSTQMGDAMKDTDNQFLSPTLDARWLARQMVRIVESGLSDHLVAPHYAHLLLPNLRSLPDYFRWLVATVRRDRGFALRCAEQLCSYHSGSIDTGRQDARYHHGALPLLPSF